MSWKGWCSYYFCLYLMRIFPTINPIKKLVLCWSCSIQLVSSTTSELHSMGVTSIRRLICLRRFSDSGFVWKTESLKYIMVYPVFIARTMLHSELPPTFCDLEQLHNTCCSQICRQARCFFSPQLGFSWVLSQEASYSLDWLIYTFISWCTVASNGITEEIQICTSWLILKQKNKKGSKNAQLLSQAFYFCKFAIFPLSKATYMARNTQYGRPLAKA